MKTSKFFFLVLGIACLISNAAQARFSEVVEANMRMWEESGWASTEYKGMLKMWRERGDTATINDAFGHVIEFGTAGLRGPMGPGTNRLNEFTVARATQGLADYLYKTHKTNPAEKKLTVVIGYDSRHNSEKFAKVVADVLVANQINVCMFDEMRPTPEISFAVLYLKADAAVNITASHNVKEDNGYKAYWSDGGQIVPPHDAGIMDKVKETPAGEIHSQLVEEMDYGERFSKTGEIDSAYIKMTQTALLDPVAIRKAKDLKIVYTPLHGAGAKMVPPCLKEMGISHVSEVALQQPDGGKFASTDTIPSRQANPEDANAMQMVRKQAEKENADLAVATDPDADRFGFYCKDSQNAWHRIDGHQSTMLFTKYIIDTRKRLGMMPEKPFMGRTIVTSEIVKRIADEAGIKMYDEYTGFKWIANRIERLSKVAPDSTFIGAGEESFCYLPYDKVRDKDAPASICLLAEMTASAKMRGTTLWDELMNIYRHYGFQREYTAKLELEAKNGLSWIDNKQLVMDVFRKNMTDIIGESFVCYDFQKESVYKSRNLPQADNTLQYYTNDRKVKVTIRPSGTEPLLKIYVEVPNADFKATGDYDAAVRQTDIIKDQIIQQFNELLTKNSFEIKKIK